MEKSTKLGFNEFLADVRFVITSPTRRFPVILERGALWGSILLLAAPVYFGFGHAGGIYFDHDPFPGYSLLLPAVLATAAQVLKALLIHFFERLFEGKRHFSAGTDTFRNMLTLFGYSSVPGTLALILATVLFFLVPGQIGAALQEFRVLTISVFVAIAAGLFIWNLILFVLAMRLVYPMRDYKIVVALMIGSFVVGLPAAAASTFVSGRVHVPYSYLQPLISSRVLGLFASTPEESQGKDEKLAVDVDLMVYKFKMPGRFDLVAYDMVTGKPAQEHQHGGRWVYRSPAIFSWHRGTQLVGRIVGLPGDTVELNHGRLRINGQDWAEPYIPPEFQTNASLPPTHLGNTECLILPDNRRLIESVKDTWLVTPDRITGRVLLVKWPLGWALFQPTAFLHASPLTTAP